MKRSSFLIFLGITVVLLGLLIFFNASAPLRFARAQMFRGVSFFIHPLNSFRIWQSGSRTADSQMNRDREGKLAAALAGIEELTAENNSLRLALGLKDKHKGALQGSSVIYYGSEFGKEYLLIDRGANEHIQKGSVVVDANGLLVGTVKDVENLFAKVGIAANMDEVFDVELLPLGVKAFAKGLGNRAFSIELLPQNATVRSGDYVMMKGAQLSLLLGEVVRAETSNTGTFKEVRAVLASHPDLEEAVFVILSK